MVVGVKINRDAILLDENNQGDAQSFSWELGQIAKLLKGLPSVFNEGLNDILRAK
jgi:hypothetical protein